MGGTSTTTQQQQSTTAPWAAAQPALQGILGQLSGELGNTGVTPGETNAINSIIGTAGNAGQFNSGINNAVSSLLAGGGALGQAPAVQAAYNQYAANTSPLANNTNYNPMSTPGIGDQLQALKDQITTGVNGSFAAAGRDGSGYNQKALGQGIAAGLAPVLTNQYNQNVTNQQNAASNLYNAGNTNAGILSGLQQQYVSNQGQGINAANSGLQTQLAGPSAALAAELQAQGIPIQNLGLLSQIGSSIAGLGSQSSGTSNSQTQLPWYAPFSAIGGAANGLLGNFGTGKAFPSILGG